MAWLIRRGVTQSPIAVSVPSTRSRLQEYVVADPGLVPHQEVGVERGVRGSAEDGRRTGALLTSSGTTSRWATCERRRHRRPAAVASGRDALHGDPGRERGQRGHEGHLPSTPSQGFRSAVGRPEPVRLVVHHGSAGLAVERHDRGPGRQPRLPAPADRQEVGRAVEPVAMTTWSARPLISARSSVEIGAPRLTSTLSRLRLTREVVDDVDQRRAMGGGRSDAHRSCRARSRASNNVTRWPRSAATRAASSPAGPPPIT